MKVVTIGGKFGAGKTTAMLRIAAGLPESHSCLYVVDTYDRIWYPAKVFGEMSSRPLTFYAREQARPLDRYNDIFLDIDGPAPDWLSLVLLADGHVYVRQLTDPPPAKDPSWRAAMEGVARHHTTRIDQLSDRVNALAESLSRRLDALEKQVGPGCCDPTPFYRARAYQPDPDMSRLADLYNGMDTTSALIADMIASRPRPCAPSRQCKCSPDCAVTRAFIDRAEKLGVKL